VLFGDVLELVLVGVPQVDGRLADHTPDHPVVGVYLDALALRDGAVGAADPRGVDESVVDTTDHEADLVGVPGEGDGRIAAFSRALPARTVRGASLRATFDDCHCVSVLVGSHVVGELRDVLHPAALYVGLEPRRTRCREQIGEEIPA
jgi:hypothetical protein